MPKKVTCNSKNWEIKSNHEKREEKEKERETDLERKSRVDSQRW
jgi:hypothetical protein